jgi:hypothetical protein
MSIAEILIWESTNLLLLIPVVLGLVIGTRWWKGQPVFTDRDWRFLFGHHARKSLPHGCGCGCGALAGRGAGCSRYRVLCDAAWSRMVSCRGAAWHNRYFSDYAEVDAVKSIAEGRGQT